MPGGVSAILNNVYVVDLVVSFVEAQDAEKVSRETISINAALVSAYEILCQMTKLQAILSAEDEKSSNVISMERQFSVDKVLGMW